MSRRTIIIIVVALLVLCCGCGGIGFAVAGTGGLAILGATQPAVDTSTNFMTAIKDSNWQAATNLCTPDLQREIAQQGGMQRFIEGNRVKPESWNFTSRNMNNNTAEVSGTAVFTGGRKGTVEINLANTNGWKITSISRSED